jgi:hypothetical protein
MVSTTRQDPIQTRSRTRSQARTTAVSNTTDDSHRRRNSREEPVDGATSKEALTTVDRPQLQSTTNQSEPPFEGASENSSPLSSAPSWLRSPQTGPRSSSQNLAGLDAEEELAKNLGSHADARRQILECAGRLRAIAQNGHLWAEVTEDRTPARQEVDNSGTVETAIESMPTSLHETADKETQTGVEPSDKTAKAIAAVDSFSRMRAVLELRRGHLTHAQQKLRRREAHLFKIYGKCTLNVESFTAEELTQQFTPLTSAQRAAVQRWERAKKLEATMKGMLETVQIKVDAFLQGIPDLARTALAPAPNPHAGELLELTMASAEKRTPASLFTNSPDVEENEGPLEEHAQVKVSAPAADVALRRSGLSQLINRYKVAKRKRDASRQWLAAFLRSRTIEPLEGETEEELNRRTLESMLILNEHVRMADSEFSEIAKEAQEQDAISTYSMSGRFPLYDADPDYAAVERQAETDHSMDNTDYGAIYEWVPRPGIGLNNDVDRADLTDSESGWFDDLCDVALGEEVNDWETDHRRRKYIDTWQEDPWSLFEHQMEVEWPDERVDRPDVDRWGPDLAPNTVDRRDTTTIVEVEDRGLPVERLETRSDPGVGGSSNGSSENGPRPLRRGMLAACPHM